MAELFDKVKQEIGKGISVVSLKSKEVMESMKIKKQVETLHVQKEAAITELGQLVYTMFIQGVLDPLKINEKCEAIKVTHTQLKEKEAELSQLHLETGEALGKVYCSKCKTEVSEGSIYCKICGEKVGEQTEE